MMEKTNAVRRDVCSSEDGSSLVAVIGIGFVMLLLVSTVLTSSFNGWRRANESEDYHAALAAAEAGINDYLYRLNQDGNYWQYTSPTAPSPNPPPDGNAALAGPVPLPGGASDATFTYSTDIAEIAAQGTVGLTVQGIVNDEVRQIDVTLRRRSFLDYLYFTDFETQDPGGHNLPSSRRANMEAGCYEYRYDGRVGGNNPCTDIVFGAGRGEFVFDGELFDGIDPEIQAMFYGADE